MGEDAIEQGADITEAENVAEAETPADANEDANLGAAEGDEIGEKED